MAAPSFSTPFQPYVYQSQQSSVTPFQVVGGETQIVQIMLKPQAKVTAKPGSLCYMSGSIQKENTYMPENEGGFVQWLFGKSVTSIVLSNTGPDDGFVGIAAQSPGRILPIDLANFGGEMWCQPDAFLCSMNDVTVRNVVDQGARNFVASIEGILKRKLVGQGLAFLTAGGSAMQKTLSAGEVLVVDAACILAMTSSVDCQIKYPNPVRRVVFPICKVFRTFHLLPGDNKVIASLTGPGIVFIQSLPFHRLSRQIARAVTSPNMRENPRFIVHIAVFLFIAYVMIVSSLVLTDV